MKSKNHTAVHHTKEQDVVVSEEIRAELLTHPTHEEIQQRAYEIHLERGGIHGLHLEDWLQAEEELKTKYPAS